MKILILLFALCVSAWAKRAAPAKLPPLRSEGITYSIEARGDRTGYERFLVAGKRGRQIWKTSLYKHEFDPHLEQDVQMVEIASWSLADGKVLLKDERGTEYVVDAASGRLISPAPSVSGFVLKDVAKGSVYERIGLRAGDRILSINGTPYDGKTDFPALLKAGGPMNIEIVRDRHVEILALELETAK